jgi:hypothetical protein
MCRRIDAVLQVVLAYAGRSSLSQQQQHGEDRTAQRRMIVSDSSIAPIQVRAVLVQLDV